MARFQEMLDSLQQKRDELMVQIKLGSMEAKEEWDALEEKWEKFSQQATVELEEGGKKLSEELETVGEQLQEGYKRIKNALR